MQPFYEFTDAQRYGLHTLLESGPADPYLDYLAFARQIAELARDDVPEFFRDVCSGIRAERESGVSDTHVLRNCPIDAVIPELDHDDPVADKRAKKKTFVGEAFLALFGRLTATPLMAYGSRNSGDFFTDVVAI